MKEYEENLKERIDEKMNDATTVCLDEFREREGRKLNIMLFNVPESEKEDPEDKKKDDVISKNLNYSNFLCMAICGCFSDFFIRIFFHKLHFFSKNVTLKPTWETNQMIDHCIHAQEFRYLPHNCCVKITWTLTIHFWRSIHFFYQK